MTKSEFEGIYRAHFGIVYRYLLRLCHVPQLAEEITSESFFRALTAIDQFDGRCEMDSWLCQIAKNTYCSYLRKNKKIADTASAPELADNSMDIEQQCCEQDMSVRAYKALHRMEDPYKEVFYLRVFGELSFRQIADIYGKTDNWACVTYHRARQKIQTILEGNK